MITIFYFTPNVDWDLIDEVYGKEYTNVDELTIEQCRTLHTFANKEWGEEVFEYTPQSFEEAFNYDCISDMGYIRIFENKSK